MMTEEKEDLEIDLHNRIELIDAIILKHTKLIEKYNTEFQELDVHFNQFNALIEENKRKHEIMVERIDVLKEKRQQLYHQVELTLEKILNTKEKEMNVLREKIMHAKSVNSIEEEKKLIELLYTSVLDIENFHNISLINEVKPKIQEAASSHEELNDIISSDRNYNTDLQNNQKELEKAKPRHSWLEKRIQSHKEALNYWDNQKNIEKEVKAL